MTTSSRLRPAAPRSTGPHPISQPSARRAIRLLALVGLAVVGCATAPGSGPEGPAPGPGAGDDAPGRAVGDAPRERAAAALEDVRRHLEAGRYHAAALRADSLYFRTRTRPELESTAAEALSREAEALAQDGELGEAAARLRDLLRDHLDHVDDDVAVRLARLSIARADDPAAAGTLLRWHGDGAGPALRLARRAGEGMSVGELESVLDGGAEGGTGPVRAVLLAELAVARARAGLDEGARAAARRVLDADPPGDAADRARAVLEGAIGRRSGPVRVGLLLPRSGRLSTVGDRILEGAELAVEGHGGTQPVELVTVDTGPDGGPIRRLVGELEDRGAVAIVGPVRAEGLRRASTARADSGRLLLSPTAARTDVREPAVFTLWDRRQKEREAARRLGGWVTDVLGRLPVGAVYPDDGAGRRAFLDFRRALATGGAWMAAAHTYESGATTLEDAITAVSAFGPRAVFAPGGGATSVLQMAPQLSYYGIRGALVAGGPDWSRPSTVRRLEPSFSQRRIVATFVDRGAEEGAWTRFRAAYESEHRRSLSGNELPALGHDAVLWILEALDAVRPARPRAVGRRAAALDSVRGATGDLRPDPSRGTVGRRVHVKMLEDRELREASPRAARAWLESTSRSESAQIRTRRQRARAAVEESGIPLTPGEDDGP